MKDTLLIYSGGMDSTTALYEFKDRIALCLSFDYDSKHNDEEYRYARKNTKALGIDHVRIKISAIAEHLKSDLLKSGGDIPEGHYADESMKKTVVPFRNGIMLSIATGITESHDLKYVMMANHFGDHAIYPDCRGDFATIMSEAMTLGTYNGVRLSAPYTMLTKRDIALRGKALGVNYKNTYSCYKGGKTHCGKCGTCVERIEALEGFDPTTYDVN